MREIKFRAWDGKRMVTQNQNYYLSFSCKSIAQITEPMAVDMRHFGSTDRLNYKDPSKYILMQYTGLKDKNGKGADIYEGDILEHPYGTRFVVKWDDVATRFVAHYGENDYAALSLQVNNKGQAKVIGNIYQNPELLNA